MTPNTGGQVAPEDLVGRDELIDELWLKLEKQSVVLTSERRMGKTSILVKMEAFPKPGYLVVHREDLEKIGSPLEFARLVVNDVQKRLGSMGKMTRHVQRLFKRLKRIDVDVFGFELTEADAPHWKDILIAAIEDLIEHTPQDRIVFLWDELPIMLQKIAKADSEATAMDVLETLRALRQTHPRLRMVLTGSIGLHHVLVNLRSVGYANPVTNDMYIQEVAPLSPEYGEELARRLLEGIGRKPTDGYRTYRAISNKVDGLPFYINHVVDKIRQRPGDLNEAMVESIVSVALTDPFSGWDLRHYHSRLEPYYGPERRKLAILMLDILANGDAPLPLRDILRLLSASTAVDDDDVREMLRLLQLDHYLTCDVDGCHSIRFPLIRRWWRLHRGL